MTAWALFLVSWLLRPGAIALTLALAVVVGAFRPRTPLVGFVGSFVTGQYPVYCSVVSVLGMGLGVLVWRGGSRGLGAVLGGVGGTGPAPRRRLDPRGELGPGRPRRGEPAGSPSVGSPSSP